MNTVIQENFLYAIMFDHRHDYIDKLQIKWFSGDYNAIYKFIVFIHQGLKKSPTYENVKGTIERTGDLKPFLKEAYVCCRKLSKQWIRLSYLWS